MEADYHQDKPWSFGDAKQIKNHRPDLKRSEIDKFLTKNAHQFKIDVFQRHVLIEFACDYY